MNKSISKYVALSIRVFQPISMAVTRRPLRSLALKWRKPAFDI